MCGKSSPSAMDERVASSAAESVVEETGGHQADAGAWLEGDGPSRELKLGHFIVEFATPGIGQILKAAGCDFTLFDTEHSGFGFETIKSVLRYMQAADLPTIVRVPSKEYHHIARAADMGAEGIMLPMVGSAEERARSSTA